MTFSNAQGRKPTRLDKKPCAWKEWWNPSSAEWRRHITERKQSERALKESEEKFRVIFEDSKDGIVLVDVDSKKFHMGNNTFCDMVQYTLDEIRQLGILDIHPEEDVP